MDKKKSVAFIFSALYVGGAERFGISLANRFAESGIPTCFIVFEKIDSPCYQLVDKRIRLIHMGRKSKLDILYHRKFKAVLEDNGITDAFYFCLNPLLYTRLFASGAGVKTRFYVTLHSTIPVNAKESLKTRLLLRFVRKTDKTIFICRNQREYHKEKYHFAPPNHTIIYNGVDTNHFIPGNSAISVEQRNRLKIPAGDRIILLVATLRPEKGHADALEALKLLHMLYPEHHNTHLVCTGGGTPGYVAELKERAVKLGLEDYFHLVGNQKDVRPYYGSADLFTLTSVSVETFSIAALEAMSCGLPLSLTDIGGASEMIFPGANGSLSEAGNPGSIAESWHGLLNMNLNREAIRKLAVEHFSIDKTFAAYLKLIDSRATGMDN